jgi:hypothetical protein
MNGLQARPKIPNSDVIALNTEPSDLWHSDLRNLRLAVECGVEKLHRRNRKNCSASGRKERSVGEPVKSLGKSH